MKIVNAIRVAEWRDIKFLVTLTIDEATALKILARRWHCRSLADIGDAVIGSLVNERGNAEAFVHVTPRNVITADAFAEAELAVTDADSAEIWPPKMRAALETLSRRLKNTRAALVF